MGLDITAYLRLTLAPEAKLDSNGDPVDYDKYQRIRSSVIEYTEFRFPGRTTGLSAGIYTAGDTFSFSAGAYSGHSRFREMLAAAVGLPEPRTIWDAPEPIYGPFVELIDFSDCGGIIGPVVSAKLARDFAENESKVLVNSKDDSLFSTKYRAWRRAFEMAADGGAVSFH